MSHRYNHIPLLPSDPGGSAGAGRIGLTRAQKVQKNILLTNIWNTFYQKIFPIIIKQLYTNK